MGTNPLKFVVMPLLLSIAGGFAFIAFRTYPAARSSPRRDPVISRDAPPVRLTSFSLSSKSVVGGDGRVVMGTVRLSAAAPEDLTVRLESNDQVHASYPLSVIVAAGQASETFAIEAGAVDAPMKVTLSAALGKVAKEAALTIDAPPMLASTYSGAH